jgi:pyrroline-5-carboxylate reductase
LKIMASNLRLGIIGGNGWLGNAIAHAAVTSEFVTPAGLTLSSRSDHRGAKPIPGAYWTKDNAELASRSDLIVLSVRPDQFAAVRFDTPGKLILSVMAGVPARTIANRFETDRVVRSMPNAAVSIRKSFTPWFATSEVSAQDKLLIQGLLSSCGDAAEVELESHIDYCVGLTGSGAAFPALLAEAMIKHALSQGLSPAFARRAVQGVVVNASQLMAGENFNPEQIVQEMIDYRGTTAAALQAMTAHGFVDAAHAGLAAAAHAAAAMSKE